MKTQNANWYVDAELVRRNGQLEVELKLWVHRYDGRLTEPAKVKGVVLQGADGCRSKR